MAATLAAALVGLEAELISTRVFNAVIVLMLVTSVLGPLLTERYASQLQPPSLAPQPDAWPSAWPAPESTTPFTVVVPVYNPVTQRYLLDMAALLAQHEQGRVVPLHIAQARVHMDEPQLGQNLARGHQLLRTAASISGIRGTSVETVLRVDDDIAEGISRAAREQDASLIVMGWSPRSIRAKLFGNLINDVFWSSHCPVAVARLLTEPVNIHRILVPMKNVTPEAVRALRFAQLFADTHEASITLLHVHSPWVSAEILDTLKADLAQLAAPFAHSTIQFVISEDTAATILQQAQHYDLLVLRSLRRRTAGGLAVSNVTHAVIDQLRCSVVLFGEPHS